MAKQTIDIGAVADDGTGDDLRTAFDKANDNFDELYNLAGIDRRVVVPTAGGTTNIAASTAAEIIIYLNHAATIASHTFNFPTLLNGQRLRFSCRAPITSVTLTPAAGGFAGSPVTAFVADGRAGWDWISSTGLLFRIV